MTADDAQPEPQDDHQDEPAGIDVRRVVGWIIVAGLAIGVAAAAILVYEAWAANRDALEANRTADEGAQVFPFGTDAANGAVDIAASDPGPPADVDTETS